MGILEAEYPALQRKNRKKKDLYEVEFPMLNKTAWTLSALWFALFIASTAMSSSH